MGVVNGQSVDQANTNPAFIDANQDDTTLAKLGLNDQDVSTVSGPAITNAQRELNALSTFTGKTLNGVKDETPNYTNNEGFTANQDLETRLDLVSGKFKQAGGHSHDPALTGDGTPIQASYLQGVVLRALILQGVNIIGHTGTSVDISAQFSLKVPSSNATTLGIVINNPQNVVAIRQASGANQGDSYLDAFGNIVYGRITYPGSVWTLSFYSLISSTETAYSFASASDISFYYQEIFNPLTGGPTYSPDFYLPSENTTADVVDASPTQRGVVTTGTQIFAGNKEFTGDLKASSRFFGDSQVDAVATGTLASLTNPTKLMVLLTNASLVSIQSIAPPSPVQNQNVILVNKTGVDVLVKNTNANPGEILTGTGNDITVKADQALFMSYDNVNARWVICGSAGTQFVTQAFGTSPNANGYTYNAGTGQFQLQPANTLFPGGVNILDQEFKGEKRFTEGLAFQLGLDASTVGAGATIDGGTVGVVKVQNAALTSISLLIRKNDVARLFVLINGTGTSISIRNLNGTETSTAKQIKTGTGQDITLASNASLFFIYDEDSDKWQAVGSSAQASSDGVTNLIVNGSADNSAVSIFTSYKNTAQSKPVTGTGGSPSVTSSINTSGPIYGTKDYILTKPAGNLQGEGWSVDYPVAIGYRAKALNYVVDYIVDNGTFTAGSNFGTPVDSDVIPYLYDITNNKLVEPSNFRLLTSSTTFSDTYRAEFQLDVTCTSARAIMHIATTTTNAFSLRVKTFVTPAVAPSGGYISDLVDGGPVIITGSTTNPAKGTVNIDKMKYKQVGDSYTYSFEYAHSTAGTNGSGTYSINLPFAIDLVKHPLGTVVGSLNCTQVPSINYSAVGYFTVSSATRLTPVGMYVASDNTQAVFTAFSSSFFALGSANYYFKGDVTLSSAGLSSSQRKSDGYDGRQVTAKATLALSTFATTSGTNVKIPFDTYNLDDVGGWSSGTYRIRTAGKYKIYGRISTAVTAGTGEVVAYLYKNGTAIEASPNTKSGTSSQPAANNYDFLVDLNVGDLIDLYVFQNLAAGLTLRGNNVVFGINCINIEKVAGSQSISASEKVVASYSYSLGAVAPASAETTILFNNKIEDSHGIYNISTGIITIPTSGTYAIETNVRLEGVSLAQSKFLVIRIASAFLRNTITPVPATAVASFQAAWQGPLLAGQQVFIIVNPGSQNNTIGNDPAYTQFSIRLVK